MLRSKFQAPKQVHAIRGEIVRICHDDDMANFRVFVGRELAGLATVMHRGTDVWIEELYTVPYHRRKGVASAILDHLARWEFTRNKPQYLLVYIENTDAHRLYLKLGFEEVMGSQTMLTMKRRADYQPTSTVEFNE